MNSRKLLLMVAVAVLVGAFFLFDLGRFFSLDFVKSQQAAMDAYRAAQPNSVRHTYWVDKMMSRCSSVIG